MTDFAPYELESSARRYSDEVILCLSPAPGIFAFFNNAREFLGTSSSPDVRPWLPYGQELIARRRSRKAKPSLDEILGDM